MRGFGTSAPESGNESPFAQVERRYERSLVSERGLSRATVENYLPIIHTFLAERFATRTVALNTLTVQDVNQFIVRQSQRLNHSSASCATCRRHRKVCTQNKEVSSLGSTLWGVAARASRHLADRP